MSFNALSPGEAVRSVVSDHERALSFARYIRVLFIAEARGVPINAPVSAVEYMRQFNEETARRMAIRRPFSRRRSLSLEAEKFRCYMGWRRKFPGLASARASALEVAAEWRKGSVDPQSSEIPRRS